MTVTICKSITYYHEADIPDELCELDEDGNLAHEDDFMYACYNADPNYLSDAMEWESAIHSVRTAEGDEELYVS